MDRLGGGLGRKGACKGACTSSDQGFWGGFGGPKTPKIEIKSKEKIHSEKVANRRSKMLEKATQNIQQRVSKIGLSVTSPGGSFLKDVLSAMLIFQVETD